MQMHQSVMDVQHLGPSTTLAVINEHLIINEWLDEVRKAFRKRLNGVGGTNWKNDVHAEDLDQVLRQLFLINDDDWIEAPAPQCKRKPNRAGESLNVMGADRPSNSKRTIADVDSNSVHLSNSEIHNLAFAIQGFSFALSCNQLLLTARS